jgi:hypothetical protein
MVRFCKLITGGLIKLIGKRGEIVGEKMWFMFWVKFNHRVHGGFSRRGQREII